MTPACGNGRSPVEFLADAPFLGFDARSPGSFGFARARPRSAPDESPAIHRGPSHLLSIGQTGSGKTNLVVANLLCYRGSVIVVDVRGDAAQATERFRRVFLRQRTHVLDPFGVTGLPRARLDPLDIATLPRVEAESEAQSIAATLAGSYGRERDVYWGQQAASLIGSGIAHLLQQPDPASRTMARLVDILFDEDAVCRVATMLDTEVARPSFAYAGLAAFCQLPDGPANTRYCVLSTAHSMLHSFRSAAVRSSLGPSTIDLDGLRRGEPTTVYIVVPVERLASHGVLLRLWLDVLLHVLLRRDVGPDPPTLVLVDEAAQIGPCPALKTVATYLRASGVRLWTFFQDLSQLRALYPDDWPTLVNNTSALTFMPGTALAARELADLAGVRRHDIESLSADEHLVCETSLHARAVRMARYWRDAIFAGRFDLPGRYHSGPAPTPAGSA
jgi:type IV secretion system protein VirD4